MGELLDRFLAVPTPQKVALLVVIMAGIGTGWYYLVADATKTQINREIALTGQLNEQLRKLREDEKALIELEHEIEKLKKERDAMQDQLPADAEIGSLLLKIHGQAKIVGLEISRFERQDSEVEKEYVRIPVKMTLSGTFHQINTFFFYVGKLTRIVNIENIDMQVFQRDRDSAKLNATCTATTFMYRPNSGGRR